MSDLSTDVQTVEAPDMAAPSAVMTRETLLAVDRCDRCGAQAFVATQHQASELLWCGHHYHEHEDALVDFKTLDERHKLNVRLEAAAY